MYPSFFSRSEPNALRDVFIGIFMFAALGGVFTLAANGVSHLLFDETPPFGSDELSREQLYSLRLIQAAYAGGGFFLAGLIALYCTRGKSEILRMLRIPRPPFLVFIAGVAVLFLLPVIAFSGYVNANLPLPDFLTEFKDQLLLQDQKADRMMLQFIAGEGLRDLTVNIVLVALIPAVAEEVFFRGYLQKILFRYVKPHAAIWISALVFSALHMHFSGFLPRLLLGAFMGYLFWWSGSLWTAVTAHFLNNAAALTAVYIWGADTVFSENKTEEFAAEHFPGVIASLGITLALLFIFRKISRQQTGS